MKNEDKIKKKVKHILPLNFWHILHFILSHLKLNTFPPKLVKEKQFTISYKPFIEL